MDIPQDHPFRAEARREGFDDVLVRAWPPAAEVAPHTHPFDVKAVVVAGEMWLHAAGSVQHIRAGERFELDAGVEHAERYGPEGTTLWVARRPRPAG